MSWLSHTGYGLSFDDSKELCYIPATQNPEVVMKKEHFEILLESIDSKVQITMEAVLALNLKLDTKRNNTETSTEKSIIPLSS